MMATFSGDYPGEAIVPASGAGNFLKQSGDCPYSNGDLYELAWKGGGITISSCSHRPEVLHVPPSEDDMAAWLHPIVTGGAQDRAGDDDVAWQRSDNRARTSEDSNKLLKEKSGKTVENNMATDTTSNSIARRKAIGGARSTGAHSQTEKRRRSKINKSLKTLQRLIPGCDKRCSQASILDLTIQYIKSMQRQVQAMSVAFGSGMKLVSVAPDVPGSIEGRPGLVLGPPSSMIPFAPMIPAVMMSTAPLMYRATAGVARCGGRPHVSGTRCEKQSLRQ